MGNRIKIYFGSEHISFSLPFRSVVLKCTLFLLFCFGNGTTLSAQSEVDSLEAALKATSDSEEKLNIQLHLARLYIDSNLEKSRVKLDDIASNLDDDSNIEVWLRYYLISSYYYRAEGSLEDGKNAAQTALKYADVHRDSVEYKSKIYNSLGALFDDDSKIEQAIEYQLTALRYAERSSDSSQIATVSAGIGRAYLFLEEFENAKGYYEKAIAIKENNNEYDTQLATYYTNMSSCFDAEERYEESLKYLDKAIELRKQDQNDLQLSLPYNNKAYTLFLMKRYDEAEENVLISLAYSDSLSSESDKMFAYSTYAEILFAQNRIAKAEEYMNKSIELSKKNNDLYLAKYNLDLMYNISLAKNDYENALEYYKQRSVVMDSIYNVRTRGEIEKLVLEYESEKKNKAIELLNAENELAANNLKKSRQLLIAILVVAFLALLVVLLLFSRQKTKRKTDLLVKEALEKSYQKKLSDTELRALRAQMNPHFLFNCLNSINSFIIKNEQEKASEYLSKFSMLIRKVLSNSKASKVTLTDELDALELYIEMESLRFKNAFEHKITVGENVEKDYLEIPPLIIQPYVENSIWHGLMHKSEGKGVLQVGIEQENGTLICTIEDNGIGREASALIKSKSAVKRKSFGMNITKERLEHINEKAKNTTNVTVTDLKTVSGDACGTRVVIKIAV